MEPICVQGRTLTGDDLAWLQALIEQHPDRNRTALSVRLCELWNWRNQAGRLKDMAARTLLLKLHARGLIRLPPAPKRTRRPCAQAPPALGAQLPLWPPDRIEGSLESLQPLRLELAHTTALRRHVADLLRRYHYRGFHGAVGENVQYLARDVRGRDLAVMVFGAAAWKVAARDRFIGWNRPPAGPWSSPRTAASSGPSRRPSASSAAWADAPSPAPSLSTATPGRTGRPTTRSFPVPPGIFHDGCYREVRYKEITGVYWQGATHGFGGGGL